MSILSEGLNWLSSKISAIVKSPPSHQADEYNKFGDWCEAAANALGTLGNHSAQVNAEKAADFFHGLANQYAAGNADNVAIWLFSHVTYMSTLAQELDIVSRFLLNNGFINAGKNTQSASDELMTQCASIGVQVPTK